MMHINNNSDDATKLAMNNHSIRQEHLLFDVRKRIRLARKSELFAQALERLLGQHQINRISEAIPQSPCEDFVRGMVAGLGMRIDCRAAVGFDWRNPPKQAVYFANHPFGLSDFLSGTYMLDRLGVRHIVPVISEFTHPGPLQERVVTLDHSRSSDPRQRQIHNQRTVKTLIRKVKDDHRSMFIFAAGRTARFLWKTGRIEELPWGDGFLNMARLLQVPLVPVCFDGRDHFLFHLVGAFSTDLRFNMFPWEVLRRDRSPVHITVGAPIDPEALKAPVEAENVATLRSACFRLREQLRERPSSLELFMRL